MTKRFIRIENENGISIKDKKTGYERYYAIEVIDDLNELVEENKQLKHWNKCLAKKRHEEKKHNDSLIKKFISKIDFLEKIIDGDL